jgi:hypothetical protein
MGLARLDELIGHPAALVEPMPPAKKTEPRTFANVSELLTHAFDLKYFHPNDKGEVAIQHHWVPGRGNFVVCLGENASGKSFFRRIVTSLCREAKIEAMPISMEGRGDDFGGLKFMIYGNEREESTGENSCVAVITGISTCKGRENPHVIFWDEMNLGLSDEWAAGMGQTIRAFAENMPALTYGAFVVTHSRALVRELVPLGAHFVWFGRNPPASIEEWLDAKIVPRDINELATLSRARYRLIEDILREVRK